MKHDVDIIIYTRDIGGTLSIIPLYRRLKDSYSIRVYAKDKALDYWIRDGVDVTDIESVIDVTDMGQICKFLKDVGPKLFISGTSFDDRSEFRMWKACDTLGIISFAGVDSWCNYISRFSSVFDSQLNSRSDVEMFYPTWILCIDDIAKNEMSHLGIPSEKLVSVGYLHLSEVKRQLIDNRDTKKYEAYRNQIINNPDQKIILFISEPYHKLYTEVSDGNGYGYDEQSVFNHLKDALLSQAKPNDFLLLIRPHPKESPTFWDSEKKNGALNMIIDNQTDLLNQINAADLVVGMQSQVLNEAACIGKCVMSIQIGLKREDPLFISKKGVIQTILTYDELQKDIQTFFQGDMKPSLFDPDLEACDDALHIIKEIFKYG